MQNFNDLASLERYIEQIASKALEDVAMIITETLQESINSEFYDQYDPVIYPRTYDLIAACTQINPYWDNGELKCGVVIDPTKLREIEWEYEGFKGITNGIDHDTIIDWAMDGIHGNLEIETVGRPLEYAIKALTSDNTLKYIIQDALIKAGFSANII